MPAAVAPAQVAKDGEDYAIVALTEHALVSPGVHLYGDCSATLDCVSDPASAVSPDNPRAHLWHRVHDKLEGVLWHKVPAHCTLRDVENGVLSRLEYLGNRSADLYAKKAAQLGRISESDRLVVSGCFELCSLMCKFSAEQEARVGDSRAVRPCRARMA